MNVVVPFVIWLSVIFAPNGDFAGPKLVVDNEAECRENVEYAKNNVPPGYIVTDCLRVSYAPAAARNEVEAP